MTDLLRCCQQAAIDGTSPTDHYRVCDARAEDPQREVLFDLPGTVRNTSERSETEANDAC